MLERIAPHLANISCHKNGTWAAQKIIDIVSSPQEIAMVCTNLQPFIPPLLQDQFGNYAAQLCLRFLTPTSDFLFDAMIDRCWEIGAGRFGARSMRTCLESSATTRYQQKRVAIAIILNSIVLANNPNGALLLSWLLDSSNLPGRYHLLATRFVSHLAQLCPHKVASATVLKIVNNRVDYSSSRMLIDAILVTGEASILEDILAEQVHGSSFASRLRIFVDAGADCVACLLQIHKLLSSPVLDHATRDSAINRVSSILRRNPMHHSPAYGKLCAEVGIAAPPGSYNLQSSQGSYGRYADPYSQNGYAVPSYGPGTPAPRYGSSALPSTISPPFAFPSFGSPLSPAPQQKGTVNGTVATYPGRDRRDPSPAQLSSLGKVTGMFYDSNHQQSRYSGNDNITYADAHNDQYQRQPSPRSAPLMPSLVTPDNQQAAYADQYLQNVAALQSQSQRCISEDARLLTPSLQCQASMGWSHSVRRRQISMTTWTTVMLGLA